MASGVEMKFAIYHVLGNVVNGFVLQLEDPEWITIDMIVKSRIYDVIWLELHNMISSPTASAHAIRVALEAIFRVNGMSRDMNLMEEFHHTKKAQAVARYL
jgi:hypothetical protein